MARSRAKAQKPVEAPALTAALVRRETRALADPERAANLQRFFKTGPGEYGEGDRFLGLRVPTVRALVRRFESLSLTHVRTLLRSRYHEERLLALLLLVRQYARGDVARRNTIFAMYLRETRYVNNWDLVDLSAGPIVGQHLRDGDRSLLYRLARSRSLWERRIAILATFDWIKLDDVADALALAALLLEDREDLIHKATGWMLREVGKRDPGAERTFLRQHAHKMPRTMLRYAIERFPEGERLHWLRGDARAGD